MELIRDTKAPSPERKESRENAFETFVSFAKQATAGLNETTEQEAKSVVSKFSKAAGFTQEQEKLLADNLAWQVKESKANFQAKVDAAIQIAVTKIGEAAQKELTSLQARLNKIEQKLR